MTAPFAPEVALPHIRHRAELLATQIAGETPIGIDVALRALIGMVTDLTTVVEQLAAQPATDLVAFVENVRKQVTR